MVSSVLPKIGPTQVQQGAQVGKEQLAAGMWLSVIGVGARLALSVVRPFCRCLVHSFSRRQRAEAAALANQDNSKTYSRAKPLLGSIKMSQHIE